MTVTEEKYIRMRKRKALISKLVFYLCRVFPIDRKLVSVCTFEGGGGFGCNPKYIVQALHEEHPDYRFVWFVNKDAYVKSFPDYIRKVSNTIWSRAYWLSVSKVWIDNYRKPFGTCKRKKQYYINTWHATIGFKSIGSWRGEAFSKMAYIVSKNDSDMIDRVVIDSKWCEEMYPKGMLYGGEYLKVGAPRCDILYGNRIFWKEKFHKENNIAENVKLVMFAPTFREKIIDGKRSVFSEIWSIDFKRLLINLEKKFGGEWYLCIRVHPQIASSIPKYDDNSNLSGRVIDASQADDMYEILAAMDVYITDYSSAAMDAGFCHMPVFIFADDIDKYLESRGSMLWNFSTDADEPVKNNQMMTPNIDTVLPYPVAYSNDELEERILNFNMEDYEKALVRFENDVELIFDGAASRKTAKCVATYMEK